MGKVKVLAEDIVSLISAGEVIENPSSIVKELIENSLDAGADMIDVAINEGGIKSIVVSDNGSGIQRDDCPICLLRYSTSKISTKDDIDEITTYGFRGEALASIAAVADVTITTQAEEEDIETRIGRFMFGGLGKALAMGKGQGFVQLVVEDATDKIIGCQLMSAHASDLIHELALAIQMGVTAADLGGTIHAHPSLAEAIMEAAEASHDRAIHAAPARKK